MLTATTAWLIHVGTRADNLTQHYVTFKTDVVGVQYYHGLVGKAEMVMLHRQPNNQYDPNAVQVSGTINVS